MRPTTSILVAIAAGLLVACHTLPPPYDPPADAPRLGVFPPDRIEAEAAAVLASQGVGPAIRESVMARLRELLRDPEVAPQIASPGVGAIAAFHRGGGGFLFKVTNGTGIVAFPGGVPARPIRLDHWLFGAVVGGETSYGVILAIGLRYPESFAGRYATRETGGTFAMTSFRTGFGEAWHAQHQLRIVGSGVGAIGEAGYGQLDIRFADP